MNCPHWLLALTISFSRSDRAHTDLSRSWCRVSQRTVPDVLQLPESLLRAPEGLGGPIQRAGHLTRCARERQRVQARNIAPGRHPGPTAQDHGTGATARPRGYRTAPLTRSFPHEPTPLVACGEPLRPPARHPVLGRNRLSAPRSPPKRAAGGRAPPVVYRDLPHVTARACQAFCAATVASQ